MIKIVFLGLLSICNATVRNNLHSYLYNTSSKVIPDNGINLSLSLAIRSFNNIDQIDGSVNMNIWLRYEWYDETIKWDSNNVII